MTVDQEKPKPKFVKEVLEKCMRYEKCFGVDLNSNQVKEVKLRAIRSRERKDI